MTSTLAGSGKHGHADGVGTDASFDYPGGLGLGADGTIYVGDYQANRIRKIVTRSKPAPAPRPPSPQPPSPHGAAFAWLKGTFHQHATQPLRKCHRAAKDIDGCGVAGSGCEHAQDDGK